MQLRNRRRAPAPLVIGGRPLLFALDVLEHLSGQGDEHPRAFDQGAVRQTMRRRCGWSEEYFVDATSGYGRLMLVHDVLRSSAEHGTIDAARFDASHLVWVCSDESLVEARIFERLLHLLASGELTEEDFRE